MDTCDAYLNSVGVSLENRGSTQSQTPLSTITNAAEQGKIDAIQVTSDPMISHSHLYLSTAFVRRRFRLCLFVLVSVLISSTWVTLPDGTGRAKSAAAQSEKVKTEVEVTSGLQRVTFTTPKGNKIFVNVPDLSPGDTFSGTVFGEVSGKTEAERAAGRDELSKYTVEFAGQKLPATGTTFVVNIPTSVMKDDIEGVVLRNQKGQEVARAKFSVSSQPSSRATDFKLTAVQLGEIIQVGCPCDGIIGETDYFSVSGQKIQPMAESPRNRWIFTSNKGPTQIEVGEGGRVANASIRILRLNLSAPKYQLKKGEKTTLTVEVTGLEGLQDAVPLHLENRTPAVMTMGASNVEDFTIKPSDVKAGGQYTTKRKLTGNQDGTWAIRGTVVWGAEGAAVPANREEPKAIPNPVVVPSNIDNAMQPPSKVLQEVERIRLSPSPDSITLISPAIGSLVKESPPAFSWKVSGLPVGVQRVVYTLKVVEVLQEQDLEEAVSKNAPLLERRDLTGESFQFQERGEGLVAGKIYGWRVTAFDQNGTEINRSGASFFAKLSWPPWNFCFLIPVAPTIDYCIGQSLVVGYAFYFPSGGPYSWTLNPGGASGVSTSPTITIPAGVITTPGTQPYTLTVSGPGCIKSVPITIVASPQAAAGQAWVSGAIHYWDPPAWTKFANVCCGSALKLKLDPPIVGNIQWEQSINNGPFTAIPGATGASVNINSNQLLCNPLQPVTIKYHARVSTTAPCADFISNDVFVVIYPPAQGTVTASPSPICVGSTSTISLTGNQAGTTVTWNQGPSASGPWTPLAQPPGTASFTVTPGTTTSYQAVVQWPGVIFAAGTCPPAQPTVTVVVDQKPVAGVITALHDPICPGDDSVLMLAGSSGLVQWYSSTNPNSQANPGGFFVPGNMISGATNNTTQNTNILNQTTYYGVVVSSPNGVCPSVQSAIIPVTVKPNPGPIAISGPAYICPFGTATLNVTSGGGSGTYHWYCDGAPCGPNSPTMTVTEPGNYQLEYDEGCAAVQSNVVTIQPDLLTVTITGPCCPCKGKKVQLCAVATNGVGPYTYSWSNGATTSCITIIATATTTYTVTVTDANGCKVSKSFTITVCQ